MDSKIRPGRSTRPQTLAMAALSASLMPQFPTPKRDSRLTSETKRPETIQDRAQRTLEAKVVQAEREKQTARMKELKVQHPHLNHQQRKRLLKKEVNL